MRRGFVEGQHDSSYRGVLAIPRENLNEMARTANRLGWQMTAHTTGGGATDTLLDAYEIANKETSILGRRFTVTHGNVPSARAIERAQQMGASVITFQVIMSGWFCVFTEGNYSAVEELLGIIPAKAVAVPKAVPEDNKLSIEAVCAKLLPYRQKSGRQN